MLTGARRRIGNYPGVTVEKVTGVVTDGPRPFEIVDLPGTYSLAARSPDEIIVSDALLGQQKGVDEITAAIEIGRASCRERV